MGKFITNINLHNVNEGEYSRLAQELVKESFTCESYPVKITSFINGKGIFFCEARMTIQDVTDAVLRAISRTGRKYSFFILKDKSTAYSTI